MFSLLENKDYYQVHEEKLSKKSRTAIVGSYKAALTGIKKKVEAILVALMNLIEETARASCFEGNQLMEGYYGLIFAEMKSYTTMSEYFEKRPGGRS